jgi:hypothetical protein
LRLKASENIDAEEYQIFGAYVTLRVLLSCLPYWAQYLTITSGVSVI